MSIINDIAVSGIVGWALWCCLSSSIHDGIIGKVLLLLMAFAALGVLSDPGERAETLLNVSMASLAIRHWWMKTYFPRVRHYVLRYLRAKHYPNKPR